MSYETATPYIASYVIVRDLGKIAFLMRSNTPWMNGYYGLPSGKVEKGESYSAAATREAEEEIGIKAQPEDLKFAHLMHRINEEEGTEWVDVCFEAVKWQGEPYNAEPDRHSALDWFATTDLPKKVIPSVRYMVEQIEAGNLFSEYRGV